MEEIKTELKSITENYKRQFSAKFKKSDSAIIQMKNKFSLQSDLQNKLTDELINTANKYFADNDIDDTSELKSFIKKCYLDFFNFVQDF